METTHDRDVKWVRKLDTVFVECRSIRHMWEMERFSALRSDEKRVRKPEGASQVIKRVLTCRRCGTVRNDYFGRNSRRGMFERIRSEYAYPRGYTFIRAKHDLARPISSDYNADLFRREGG